MGKCGKGKRWSIKKKACVYIRKKGTHVLLAQQEKALKKYYRKGHTSK